MPPHKQFCIRLMKNYMKKKNIYRTCQRPAIKFFRQRVAALRDASVLVYSKGKMTLTIYLSKP